MIPARRFSSCARLFRQDIEIIHRLRKQERVSAVSLDADIDEFLRRFQPFYKSKSELDQSSKAAMRQNKYISTERLKHADRVATLGEDVVEQFNELKEHLKDLEEEPYPEWQPGDSDAILRSLSDPNLKIDDVELEMKTREKDTKASLDIIEEQHKGLLAVRNAWLNKGRAAGEAVADNFVKKRKSHYTHINATLEPVDLDTISEDTPSLLASTKKKAI